MKKLLLISILAIIPIVGYANDILTDNHYCNTKFDFCIDIPIQMLPLYQSFNYDGFRIIDKNRDIKILVSGYLYNKENEYDNKNSFTEQILKPSLVEHKLIKHWHFSEIKNGVNNTSMISKDGKNSAYRYWQYNDNGFIDFVVVYPNKYENEIEPIIQQMTQSIVLK